MSQAEWKYDLGIWSLSKNERGSQHRLWRGRREDVGEGRGGREGEREREEYVRDSAQSFACKRKIIISNNNNHSARL